MSENPREGIDRRDFMIALAPLARRLYSPETLALPKPKRRRHPLATRHRVHRRGRSTPAM